MLARAQAGPDDQMLQRTESLAMLPEYRQQPGRRLPGCQQTVRSKLIPAMGCQDLLPDDFSPDLPAAPGAALCSQVPVQVGPASVARRLHLFERQQLHSSLGEPDSLFAHGTHAKITGQKQWRGWMKLVPLRSTERDR